MLIGSYKNEILICMYAFTFDKLSEMLLHKQQSGCTVKVITDISREDNENDQIPQLKSKGIKVREWALNKKEMYTPKMHNKFAIIDDKMVIHGSADWIVAAFLHNREAITISYDPNLINSFRAYFEIQWIEL